MKKQKVESAGAVVYFISKGKLVYLILKHIKIGGHWGFPKGRREKGETELENAKREVLEETNINDIIYDRKFKEILKYFFSIEDTLYEKTVSYFLAESSESNVKLSEEHIEFFWGRFEDILKKLGKSSDKEVLIKANRYLKNKI